VTLAQSCEQECERRAAATRVVADVVNYIVDCTIAEIPGPVALEAHLCALIGVVESSHFVGQASRIVVGRSAGMEVIER
jgi:ribose 5-phosphate isomerase